ncbi:MAG: hypothetical protein IJW54_02175 [Clostridia bacterium]|nr:hypothetical protein [Clostridia bacterium]
MERKEIAIDLLLLSNENPRLEPAFSEDESITNMVKEQGDKLVVLASDIVQFGLNPMDTIGVYPSDTYVGYYEVGEGNRRLCALKLLIDPNRISLINPNMSNKFKELAKNFTVPQNIEVGVFKNELDMRHWMELRHMGEQGGKGLTKWDSVQKMRFQKSQSGQDILLDFWTWMIENDILTEDEVLRVTKTNWQRVLRDKYYPFLKIYENGRYNVNQSDIEVFTERIRCIQKNLAGQTVAIVYDQEKIEDFYNFVSIELYGIPYKQVVENETEQILIKVEPKDTPVNVEKNGNKLTGKDKQPEINEKTTEEVSRDLFNNCSTIIPFNYKIRTSNMRLNKIINELKRLNPDYFPNACGTLLRTLFELSAKVFLENETKVDQTEVHFQDAIRAAANTLREKGRITNDQHSSILKDIDNLRKIFNGYMHNTDGYPNGLALKDFFKSHVTFIRECLM